MTHRRTATALRTIARRTTSAPRRSIRRRPGTGAASVSIRRRSAPAARVIAPVGVGGSVIPAVTFETSTSAAVKRRRPQPRFEPRQDGSTRAVKRVRDAGGTGARLCSSDRRAVHGVRIAENHDVARGVHGRDRHLVSPSAQSPGRSLRRPQSPPLRRRRRSCMSRPRSAASKAGLDVEDSATHAATCRRCCDRSRRGARHRERHRSASAPRGSLKLRRAGVVPAQMAKIRRRAGAARRASRDRSLRRPNVRRATKPARRASASPPAVSTPASARRSSGAMLPAGACAHRLPRRAL